MWRGAAADGLHLLTQRCHGNQNAGGGEYINKEFTRTNSGLTNTARECLGINSENIECLIYMYNVLARAYTRGHATTYEQKTKVGGGKVQ